MSVMRSISCILSYLSSKVTFFLILIGKLAQRTIRSLRFPARIGDAMTVGALVVVSVDDDK